MLSGISAKDKIERDMLAIISNADGQPLGCGAISNLLSKHGQNISEATVGRYLRDFDNMKYTEKVSNQGRILSQKGKDRIGTISNQEATFLGGIRFAETIRSHTKEDLIEVLVARRAIESELAYLAALNNNKNCRDKLKMIIEEQKKQIADVTSFSGQDVVFHKAVAKMAQNRVLEAAISLIRQDTQLSPILTHIRKEVNKRIYIDHMTIYEAIVAGKPEEAREAMKAHIDGLVQDVINYWEQKEKSGKNSGCSS